MKLFQLLGCEKKLAELEIKGITNDSRLVKDGYVFVNCEKNLTYDKDAFKKGAAVIITNTDAEFENVIKVENPSQTFAKISALWYGNPADSLKILGVTGTNGKTSTTYMIKTILEKAGKKVGLIGTNQNMIGDRVIPSINTTPNAYYLNGLFYQMKKANCEYVVMEVSSHALAKENVYGIKFSAAIFTNLTQDHLDYHKTMDNYFAAKNKLFSMCDVAILNADSEFSKKITTTSKVVTYGIENSADYNAKAINCSPSAVSYKLLSDGLTHIEVNTGGNFTVYNSLCAIICAIEMGIDIDIIATALKEFNGVPGRAEVIKGLADFTVILDYAHTPDGLKNILKTFKSCAKNRLIVLFGCGGDRDKTKRSQMGEIASIFADYVIVTTDNPRTEKPREIINDILKGIPNGMFNGKIIEDRKEAINFAISIAEKDDIIVLAGKGHENYQIIGRTKIPFDEREIVRSALHNKLNK